MLWTLFINIKYHLNISASNTEVFWSSPQKGPCSFVVIAFQGIKIPENMIINVLFNFHVHKFWSREKKKPTICTAKAALTGMHVLWCNPSFQESASYCSVTASTGHKPVRSQWNGGSGEGADADWQRGRGLGIQAQENHGKTWEQPLKIDLACHLKPWKKLLFSTFLLSVLIYILSKLQQNTSDWKRNWCKTGFYWLIKEMP